MTELPQDGSPRLRPTQQMTAPTAFHRLLRQCCLSMQPASCEISDVRLPASHASRNSSCVQLSPRPTPLSLWSRSIVAGERFRKLDVFELHLFQNWQNSDPVNVEAGGFAQSLRRIFRFIRRYPTIGRFADRDFAYVAANRSRQGFRYQAAKVVIRAYRLYRRCLAQFTLWFSEPEVSPDRSYSRDCFAIARDGGGPFDIQSIRSGSKEGVYLSRPNSPTLPSSHVWRRSRRSVRCKPSSHHAVPRDNRALHLRSIVVDADRIHRQRRH